jgi:hypothetical protein
MSPLVVVAVIMGSLVIGLVMVAVLGMTLGRRARAGRLSGRYTSNPGNSRDASSTAGGHVG